LSHRVGRAAPPGSLLQSPVGYRRRGGQARIRRRCPQEATERQPGDPPHPHPPPRRWPSAALPPQHRRPPTPLSSMPLVHGAVGLAPADPRRAAQDPCAASRHPSSSRPLARRSRAHRPAAHAHLPGSGGFPTSTTQGHRRREGSGRFRRGEHPHARRGEHRPSPLGAVEELLQR
jgi:hypothetical protein